MTGLTEWEELIFKLEQELKSVKLERDGFKEALASLRCKAIINEIVLVHEEHLFLNAVTPSFYNNIIYPIQKELGMDVQKVEE